MAFSEQYDVAVVGAGHAGCEAAMAAARMGLKTALITMNLDLIAQMSCNPAIGGVAKGHLVREVDALGGIMGEVADAVGIQFRLLNTSRGPAVWSPRAQCDKQLYRVKMREVLESQPGLHIRQAEVVDLVIEEGRPESTTHEPGKERLGGKPRVLGLKLRDGRRLLAGATIITTGTFLNGLIHCGEEKYPAGRSGEPASVLLGEALRALGLRTCRLKTGTPPRLDGRTIRWEAFEEQAGDADPTPFSFRTKKIVQPQISCHIAFTTPETLRIVRENVHRSAMYSGQIAGIGPRYCPSIEDKIVKFPDKTQHQFFLEPEGLHTHEVYINGMSTSLPMEVQWRIVHSIPGLDQAEMLRPGYAIEYDSVDATELDRSLRVKAFTGLYLAGQINGTSGYEEAACQGIMAGINAALAVKDEPPLVLDRTEAYTAILIDDLVAKGTNEPYRMFTSRAEFRLHLRIDNADRRLTPYGRRIGLIGDDAWHDYLERQERMAALQAKLEQARLNPELLEELARALDPPRGAESTAAEPDAPGALEASAAGSAPAHRNSLLGLTLAQMLRRPELSIERLLPALREVAPDFFKERQPRASSVADRSRPAFSGYVVLPAFAPRQGRPHGEKMDSEPASAVGSLSTLSAPLRAELKSVETEIKYAGYLNQQVKAMERLKKAEQRIIPEWFDYGTVSGLSREMKEKLQRVRPRTLGQASRLPGVTPAAVSLVNVYIEIQARKRHAENLACPPPKET